MRACEGCRRRKIKCDSATTNSWPCAACTRLKLNCVPPTVSYEKESSTPGVHTFEVRGTNNDYPTVPVGTIGDYQRPPPMQPQQQAPYATIPSTIPASMQTAYPDHMPVYQVAPYMEPDPGPAPMHYGSMPTGPLQAPDMHPQNLYGSPVAARPSTDGSFSSGPTLADSLSEAMGELRIDVLASAPYIADKKKLAEAPAVEEYEINLPHDTSPDLRVRIPLEMMPSDQQAMQYFQYFFENIHPYVPVLSRPSFYHQWNTNRDSISPFVLEGIFACAAFMMNDQSQGQKWLALASSSLHVMHP